MRSISARSVVVALRCAVFLSVLTFQAAPKVAASDAVAQGTFPPECGAGVLSPVKVKAIGELVAKAYTECSGGTSRYLRLAVKLQQKVDGVWRWRAGAIGEATHLLSRLAVKVSGPCRIGRYRTFSVHSFRQNRTDPWHVGLQWASPLTFVRTCPRSSVQSAVASDERLATVSDFPVGCGATDHWPTRRQGRLIARSESVCDSPWYMRDTGSLERQVDGAWRTVAAARADAVQLIRSLIVKVSIPVPCGLRLYRTYGLHAFRQDPADPWQVVPFHSAVVGRGVDCPR
jgi:hypothetical protein